MTKFVYRVYTAKLKTGQTLFKLVCTGTEIYGAYNSTLLINDYTITTAGKHNTSNVIMMYLWILHNRPAS